jgi:hypothetical protein
MSQQTTVRARGALSPAACAHLVTVVAALAWALAQGRKQWFRDDEWDFLARPAGSLNPLDLLQPHSEHLSVLPRLAYAGLFAAFGLRTYLPYVAMAAVAHVATAHLAWRLGRRAGADPWINTAAVTVFLFLGAGFFNIVFGFQVSFIGSTFFGLAALLVLDVREPPRGGRLAVAWALCVGSILCSGLGPVMTVIAALFTWVRHGRRQGLVVAGAPLAVYLAWFLAIGHRHLASLGLVGKTAYLQLPDFAWRGLTAAAEGSTGMKGAGAVLVLALAVFLVRERAWSTPALQVTAALGLGAVLLLLVTGSGRLVFGPEYATQSRYVYEVSALLLVPAAVGLTVLAAGNRVAWAVVLSALLLAAGRGAYELKTSSDFRAAEYGPQKAQLLATARLVHDRAPVVAADRTLVQPDFLDLAGVRRLVSSGDLPIEAAPGEDDPSFLAARLRLEVGVTAGDGSPPAGTATFDRASGIAQRPAGPGCIDFDSSGEASRLWFSSSGRSAVTLTSAQSGELGLSLQADGPGGVLAPFSRSSVARGGRVLVTVDAPGFELVLTPPAGRGEVCAAAPG